MNKKRIGIALGSGSARGWAHIGVLQELSNMGINPDVVAGCSVGSLVGAIGAAGYLDELEDWVLSLNMRNVWNLMDVSLNGGLVRGEKILNFFREAGIDMNIEDMPCAYAAVATELGTGQERWLRTGPVLDAVRASCTFPGLFRPVCNDGAWLLDGGLVNPVPVSLCRALGADIVLAVDLNTHLVGRHGVRHADGEYGNAPQKEIDQNPPEVDEETNSTFGQIKQWFNHNLPQQTDQEQEQDAVDSPGIMDVMAASINIMQDRITRSRMAGDPPDILLSPRVGDIGMTDFSRAADAIQEGRAVVEGARSRIIDVCGLPVTP